jgi:hypothetical protein
MENEITYIIYYSEKTITTAKIFYEPLIYANVR